MLQNSKMAMVLVTSEREKRVKDGRSWGSRSGLPVPTQQPQHRRVKERHGHPASNLHRTFTLQGPATATSLPLFRNPVRYLRTFFLCPSLAVIKTPNFLPHYPLRRPLPTRLWFQLLHKQFLRLHAVSSPPASPPIPLSIISCYASKAGTNTKTSCYTSA